MKIYQVHEYGGEWEDSFDRIVKSTTKKEKAEGWKKWFEDEFKRTLESSRHCYHCPLGMDDEVTPERLMEYCPRISETDLKITGSREVIDCDNYEFVYEENQQYKIEEVEVEE